MTTLDIAWLAGLLEGEGCFLLTTGTPRIALVMTDRDVVERAAKMMGSIVYARQRAQYKQTYSTSACSSRAAGTMMTVYSFMGKRRREKIKEIIQAWRASPTKPRASRSYESRIAQSCKANAKYAAAHA